MIQKIWLYPPLAVGRLGPSLIPCDSFHWAASDLRPRGTGKTTIQPGETLRVAAEGTVTSSLPTEIAFKDSVGFKPICPFFELHGEWQVDGSTVSGPITPQVLGLFGLTTRDLHWTVEVANLKPHHYTLADSDRILAIVELTGDVTERQTLRGTSPAGFLQPLVPVGQAVPLGSVQLTRPTADFPELRLRFTPAAGNVYGPTNLSTRLEILKQRLASASPPQVSTWQSFQLPPDRLILNSGAVWCQFAATGEDPRTNPGGLYASEDDTGISLGLVDDVCDGAIRCSLPGGLQAIAWIAVGPPDYAPDRRPVVSLADGLADRVLRHEVLEPAYVDQLELTAAEVDDILERVLETMESINLDFQNQRVRAENQAIAITQGLSETAAEDKAFALMNALPGQPLPLTALGRQRHRRLIALEVLEDKLREQPDLINKWIREPKTSDRYYDRKMPALMRGSDRYPMHITRRQYDLLMAWANRLRRDAEAGT
jgi:hypothetical protein